MASPSIVAARAQQANEKAMEVIAQHGGAERIENLQTITISQAVVRNPHHLAAFQAELIASLAEIVEGQARQITALKEIVEEQGSRITELEKGAQAAAKAPKK